MPAAYRGVMRTPPKIKTTDYFRHTRLRKDRRDIQDDWIESAVRNPIREVVQSDGRFQRWVYIDSERKYLRMIVLEDGETVHNAFFDRRFRR